MRQIGLALSGGGFRATLYHLGVVRFLRDAGLLEHVSHITSVSGGSVLAAHLALNWDRYCGSENEFEDAANEVTRFIQLDVRNRIVRRYPLAAFLNGTRRVIRMGGDRRLTRPGLLESYYEKHLYGDKCLIELPEHPQLHILATNVGEGSLSSFTRRGIISQTRLSDDRQGFKLVQSGLATVAMAVAASSAFPGFFPPLELTAWDVGACESEFPPHSFTDGGVFDNLGIRMFRWMEQSWMQHDNPLRVDDFVDIEEVLNAIRAADLSDDESPIHRIASLVASALPEHTLGADQLTKKEGNTQLAKSLWGVVENHRLYADPAFEEIRPTDPAIDSLLNLTRTTGRQPDWGDHLRLNRHLLDSALQQVIGHPCFYGDKHGSRAIIVSDAGKKITSVAGNQGSGLIQTAIRSSEILMNRVWQLERETFDDTPGFFFASINDVVSPSRDRYALHPEVQQQVNGVRTDLDYFNDLEIRSLAQHGYCVARNTCRSSPESFGNDLPDGPPWDPIADSRSTSVAFAGGVSESIQCARKLQKSSKRRIWSAMFSLSDWPTYVWIPLILLLLFGGPYSYMAANRKARRNETVLTATHQAKQIEVQITSAVRTLHADATFMSTLPPIQGIIDARKSPEANPAKPYEGESEEVWRERLEAIFEGLLRANPACLSGIYLQLDESGGREIVRVERYERENALVHIMPEERLGRVVADESLTEISRLRPGEVKVFCANLNRVGSEDERIAEKRLIAAAAVHDHANGDFFGMVLLELDVRSAVGSLLVPVAGSVDAVYVTDQNGVVVLSSRANSIARSPTAETNIVTLIPQAAEFLASGDQAKILTDERSFVVLKIWLEPDNPASVIQVVIGFTT
jgi:predicted acylesterase/phospholipase RssA